MKIMPLSPSKNAIAHLNPLEPVYKQVSSCLSEDTFGKALQDFRKGLIDAPPGLGLQVGEKQLSKNDAPARVGSFHDDAFEESTKSEA
jgi:hypothetical protein